MFTGFTDETVDFMWGIRFNNDRAWFQAHKEEYLQPLSQPVLSFHLPLMSIGLLLLNVIQSSSLGHSMFCLVSLTVN